MSSPEAGAGQGAAAGTATPAAAAAPSIPAAPATPLSRNRNFQLLWVGQVLSDLGSEFGALAYPLLVLALTHSAIVAGAVGTTASIVAFAVRLPAGALADRLDRRRAMIVCDGVRAVVLGVLAVLVALHVVTWPVVLAVAVVDGLGTTLFTPSSMAALPCIVAGEQLESAWASTEARQYAASLAGPALGGLLYSIASALPFVGDAVSYGVSAATSAAMRATFASPPADGPRRGLWHEALEGVRHIWHDALLRAVIIQAPLTNLAFNGALFTIILALRRNGSSATVIGGAEAVIMVGGLLGALVAPRIQGRFRLWQLVVGITLCGTVLMAVGAAILPSPIVAAPMALSLFLSPAVNAALMAAMLRASPEEMRGRVTNALMQAATVLSTIAPLLAGLMVEEVSGSWAMGMFAAILGVSTVMAVALPGLRNAASPGDEDAARCPGSEKTARRPVAGTPAACDADPGTTEAGGIDPGTPARS